MQQGLLGLNAVARCMDYIRERSAHTGPKQQGGSGDDDDLLVMLLANLTSLEAGAEALLQVRACGCGAWVEARRVFLGP